MTVSEVVALTRSGYVSYALNTLPVSTAVLEEYMYMYSAVDELINHWMSLPTVNARHQRVSYEIPLPMPAICVIMLAYPNYVVSSSTIIGVDDTYFA